MSGRSANVSVRVEPDIKAQAEAILASLGVSTSTFVNMAYRQVILRQGIPFAVELPTASAAIKTRDMIADTEFDNSPYDAWWLDTPFWTFTALPRLGQKLTADSLDSIKEMIDACLKEPKYALGRQEVRNETWVYEGQGAKRAYDYLINMYKELTATEGGR